MEDFLLWRSSVADPLIPVRREFHLLAVNLALQRQIDEVGLHLFMNILLDIFSLCFFLHDDFYLFLIFVVFRVDEEILLTFRLWSNFVVYCFLSFCLHLCLIEHILALAHSVQNLLFLLCWLLLRFFINFYDPGFVIPGPLLAQNNQHAAWDESHKAIGCVCHRESRMLTNDCFFKLLDGAKSGHREHAIAHNLLYLHISRLSWCFLR